MVTLKMLLMLLAIILLFLAAIGISTPRCNLMAAGLCLWAIAAAIV